MAPVRFAATPRSGAAVLVAAGAVALALILRAYWVPAHRLGFADSSWTLGAPPETSARA